MKINKILLEPRYPGMPLRSSNTEFVIHIYTECGCGFTIVRDTVEELVCKLPQLVSFIESKTDFAEIAIKVCSRDL